MKKILMLFMFVFCLFSLTGCKALSEYADYVNDVCKLFDDTYDLYYGSSGYCASERTICKYTYKYLIEYKANRDYDGMKYIFSKKVLDEIGEDEFKRTCDIFFDFEIDMELDYNEFKNSNGSFTQCDTYCKAKEYIVLGDYDSNYSITFHCEIYKDKTDERNGLHYVWVKKISTVVADEKYSEDGIHVDDIC